MEETKEVRPINIKYGIPQPWGGVTILLLFLAFLGFVAFGMVVQESKNPSVSSLIDKDQLTALLEKPGEGWESHIRNYWETAGYLELFHSIEQTEDEQEMDGTSIQWDYAIHDIVLIPTQLDCDFDQVTLDFQQYLADGGYVTTLKGDAGGLEVTFLVGQVVPGQEAEIITHQIHIEHVSPTTWSQEYRRREGADSLSSIGFTGEDDSGDQPKMAIVIDDWGYRSSAVDPLLLYPFPLTVAVLPYLPISLDLADRASRFGHEVILHQPMEPLNSYLEMGKGGISTTMSPEEIREQLQANLAHLPMV